MENDDDINTVLYDGYFTGVEGDISFYIAEAQQAGGAILELGCGTGRITLAIAEAGIRIIGLDLSTSMLMCARAKRSGLPVLVRRRVKLIQDDMRTFRLQQRFAQIIIPYRTFMYLLSPLDQVAVLQNVLDHLAPQGRLIFNIYDPMKELTLNESAYNHRRYDTEFIHPISGHPVHVWYERSIDIIDQIIHQRFFFTERPANGGTEYQYESALTLRYTHRYEMHYLLEMCGFEVDALYGDFNRRPYSGSEQIWIAHKRSL